MPTVLHRLSDWSKREPRKAAQRYKENGVWKDVSVQELCDRVFHLALFLESRGFTSDDVSAILSYNKPEWVQFDLAPMLLGGLSAGLYPNASKKDIHYILNHTKAKVLAVQNREYFEKITAGGATLPATVELIVVFDGDTSISPKAIAFEKALAEGRKLAATKKLETYLAKVDKGAGAFLIFTSGTTGDPKGAVLTHDNLAYTSDIIAKAWSLKKGNGSLFSFLPLCHIAEKIQNIGVGISFNYTVSYCSKFDNVAAELAEVQPQLLLSVPRLWEKMVEGVEAKLAGAPKARQKLAGWAFGVGARVAKAKFSHKMASPLDLVQFKIADKLVLSKIRKALGLGRIERAASGAAALPAPVTLWFRSIGIEILEDFGQTESSGVICCSTPGDDCAGTVGRPVAGLEFKLASDGEILTKGRHVFKGYYKNDAATAETLVDGWLYTGDLGAVVEDGPQKGMIKIRGRKKEIMKTSGGKMIAPLPIEDRIKRSPMIGQVCLVGDGKKFATALLTLSEGALKDLQARGDNGSKTVSDIKIVTHIKEQIDIVNSELAGYEQVKYFTVLSHDFSIDKGEMTPTMKMKRSVIEANYKDIIEQMYRE